MALKTFNPPIKPQPSTSEQVTPKLLTTEFGDGYSAVTREGINHLRSEVRLAWTDIHALHAQEIVDWFAARGGDEPFWYTMPDTGTPRRYRCTRWDKTYAPADRRSITATLVLDYSLAR